MKVKIALGLLLAVCSGLGWGHAAHAMERWGVDIHGFISQGVLWSSENNYLADTDDGTFQINELGINFSRDLTEDLRMGIQLFSRDLGDIGNNEVVIDWAYGDYRWRDWLGLRAGIVKVVHGLYNETRDLDMLRVSVLMPQSIYPETYRDAYAGLAGGSVYGTVNFGVGGSVSYQVTGGTNNIENDSGLAKEIEGTGPFKVRDVDRGMVYNGGLQWHTPIEGLRMGATLLDASGMEIGLATTIPMGPHVPAGAPVTNELDFHTWVVSTEYILGNLMLSSEYTQARAENNLGVVPRFATTSEGYYLNASYRMTDRLEFGSYYSIYYPDKNDRDGNAHEAHGDPDHRAWLKDLAFTARFDLNAHSIIKLEGHAFNGSAQLYPQDNPGGYEDDWFLFAAKVTFSF